MEKRRNNFCLKTSKRLDTVKKKARELSILCNIDVCLVGKHKNQAENSSEPSKWHTWPEDQSEVARILNKYRKRIEEKKPKSLSEKEVFMVFDFDKALKRMSSFEELKRVIDRVNKLSAEVVEKLDVLSSNEDCGTHMTPMISDLPLDQTKEEANREEIISEVGSRGPKIFGVYLTPANVAQSSSDSA